MDQKTLINFDSVSSLYYFYDFDFFKLLRSDKHRIAVQTLTLSHNASAQIDSNFKSKYDPPYTLNKYQANYLLKEGIIDVKQSPNDVDELKQRVFNDLTMNKKLYVTDALKFGGHFLVY